MLPKVKEWVDHEEVWEADINESRNLVENMRKIRRLLGMWQN